MRLTRGSRLGSYEIVAPLGAGGMGEVYQARHPRLDRLVAIKILDTDALADAGRKKRFVQEAKAASSLNHPGIVTIYDVAEDRGMDYIVMEHVDGKTLFQLIGHRGLSFKKTLNYSIQIATALAKAHAAGIIHRDLKPSNIMVTRDGEVKILDFGLAKLIGPHGAGPADPLASTRTVTLGGAVVTEAGRIIGTASYMSPEQAEGRKVDQRSDIFSFGCLMYEMVTGTRAFEGSSYLSTLSAILTIDPKPPSEIVPSLPRDLERIILRCLRKDPARRCQLMADLVVALEEIKAESSTHQNVMPARPSIRSRKRVFTIATMAVAVLSAGTWRLWPVSTPPPPSAAAPLTSYPGDEALPDFSPDGNQVAFAWQGENRDNTDIYITQTGGGTPYQLTTDPAVDTSPAWSPDGARIAFVRHRPNSELATVYVAPVVGGAETKLIDFYPPPDANQPTLSWFPDGQTLAVAERKAQTSIHQIALINAAWGHPIVVASREIQGRFLAPSVSPRGDRIAYEYCRGVTGNPSCDVYVLRLDADMTARGQPRQLTTTGSFIGKIAWTNDGRAVIVPSAIGGFHLWRIPVSGSGTPERIEMAGSPATDPAIAKKGNKLAFAYGARNIEVWNLLPNEQPVPFASSTQDDEDPQFSPDGKKIAFASKRTGDMTIWVINHDGSNPTCLTPQTGRLQGSPRWSPDGQWLAYDGQGDDGHWNIYVVESGGGAARRLTPDPQDETVPSWSRDGRTIYFESNRTGRAEVWAIPADGGQSVQVTFDGGKAPRESPDGKRLYYVKETAMEDVDELFERPVAGGPERKLPMKVYNSDYFPLASGIYYVTRPDDKRPYTFELRYLDLVKGTTTVRSTFNLEGGHGLTVSRDNKTVLYAGRSLATGTDLKLINNFH